MTEPYKFPEFEVGDRVEKLSGDYQFSGRVAASFRKLDDADQSSGPWRYVVQDSRGVLMIMNAKQLRN
jgi:hypothetical protein